MARCSFEDCFKTPIRDQCFFFCIYRILSKATPGERQSILRLSSSTAQATDIAYQAQSISSFEDLASHLNAQQVDEIISVFRDIKQEQLGHFADLKA
jgi:hypothetical protein